MTNSQFVDFLNNVTNSQLREFVDLYYGQVQIPHKATNRDIVIEIQDWRRSNAYPTEADKHVKDEEIKNICKHFKNHPRLISINLCDSSDEKNHLTGLNQDEYERCFKLALYRIIATANVAKVPGFLSVEQLRRFTDDQVAEFFKNNENASKLVRFNRFEHDQDAGEKEIANDFFYGFFQFEEEKIDEIPNTKLVKVSHTSTTAFVKWSVDGFYPPKGSDEETGRNSFPNHKDYLKSCAVNYLVKNFWHNYVHNVMQGINHTNIHNYKGDTRETSDFEADNLGTIFLALSYGLTVKTDSTDEQGNPDQAELRKLFARNQCNRIFELRALKRDENESVEDKWKDLVWRSRRRIANQLSQRLLCEGLAVGELVINFSGNRKERDGFPIGYDGHVIAVLNGFYINSGFEPIINHATISPFRNSEQVANIDQRQKERNDMIVSTLVNEYRKLLKKDRHKLKAADESLQGAYRRAWFINP